ncbi:MAG: helix-turn-helix transcriptional regulator [Tissierellia bacterium]|nr:helix-turn-helix transcriptional regulator [Tissierellia bacterium]
MEFSEKLRELRTQKGITQDVAAEAIGVSIRSYKSYELGERVPRDHNTYLSMANFYGVDLNYLLADSKTLSLKVNRDRMLGRPKDSSLLLAEARTFFADKNITYSQKKQAFFDLMDIFYGSTKKTRKMNGKRAKQQKMEMDAEIDSE